MSLDVYLTLEDEVAVSGTGIYIREDGQVRELTRAEWDERFPDQEPISVNEPIFTEAIYSANITHNLGKMAAEAGIYKALWRPEEVDIETAQQLIEPLEKGLNLLESDPARFRQFNPPNGWGTYEGLVRFVRHYLEACQEYPTAKVSVWR